MKRIILISSIIFSCGLNAQEINNKEDNSLAEPDFSTIQGVLKNDQLDEPLLKKLEEKKKRLERKRAAEYRKYSFLSEDDFWNFMSEYWLVKNAPALKWDFEKPDYGLEPYFKQFLETLGYYEVSFKILLLDTPNVTHFALPTGKNKFLAILSVPFIRTLNLSKLEISLILFEDFIRVQQGYFKDYVKSEKLEKLYSKNFKKTGLDKKEIKNILKKYDEIIFDKGFNFQQQYSVTKKVSTLLKNQMKLWSTYYTLIGKINELISSNLLYKNYTKIYPSPELQLGWLKNKN